MNFQQKRPYRKKLSSTGLISINGQPQIVTIKNISITGALAELQNFTDKDDVLAALSESTSLEIQIPDLQLAGEAEIIRIESKENQISLGIKFKQLTLNSDLVQKRKLYRKKMTIPGEIMLHGNYQGFVSVNVSKNGMMIHLTNPTEIPAGTTTKFRFKKLGLEGEFKIAWTNTKPKVCTWIGGRCFNLKKTAEKSEYISTIVLSDIVQPEQLALDAPEE